MTRPGGFGQQFLDIMVRLITVHQELFLDDLPLLGDVGGGELRMPVHVRQHIEKHSEMPVAGLGVVTGIFLTGKSVEIAPDSFHSLAQLLGGAPVGALKK